VRVPRRKRRRIALAVVAFYAVVTVVARRLGYGVGGETIVRCRRGHFFTTVWIPGASLKSVRFGWWRLQRCPVGPHWSLVVPVRATDLSDDERRLALENRDGLIF
jgi:hypothetical protein